MRIFLSAHHRIVAFTEGKIISQNFPKSTLPKIYFQKNCSFNQFRVVKMLIKPVSRNFLHISLSYTNIINTKIQTFTNFLSVKSLLSFWLPQDQCCQVSGFIFNFLFLQNFPTPSWSFRISHKIRDTKYLAR